MQTTSSMHPVHCIKTTVHSVPPLLLRAAVSPRYLLSVMLRGATALICSLVLGRGKRSLAPSTGDQLRVEGICSMQEVGGCR